MNRKLEAALCLTSSAVLVSAFVIGCGGGGSGPNVQPTPVVRPTVTRAESLNGNYRGLVSLRNGQNAILEFFVVFPADGAFPPPLQARLFIVNVSNRGAATIGPMLPRLPLQGVLIDIAANLATATVTGSENTSGLGPVQFTAVVPRPGRPGSLSLTIRGESFRGPLLRFTPAQPTAFPTPDVNATPTGTPIATAEPTPTSTPLDNPTATPTAVVSKLFSAAFREVSPTNADTSPISSTATNAAFSNSFCENGQCSVFLDGEIAAAQFGRVLEAFVFFPSSQSLAVGQEFVVDSNSATAMRARIVYRERTDSVEDVRVWQAISGSVIIEERSASILQVRFQNALMTPSQSFTGNQATGSFRVTGRLRSNRR